MDINTFLQEVGTNNENVITVARKILGENNEEKIIEQTVSLKNQVLPPIRAVEEHEGCHTFHRIAEFVTYLQKYGGEDSVVLGCATSGVIKAALTETDDQPSVVNFTPCYHAFFQPWQEALSDEIISLDALSILIKKTRQLINSPEPLSLSKSLRQVQISKDVKLLRGKDAQNANGQIVETKVMIGQQESVGRETIPDFMHLLAPVFVDSEPVSIEVELHVFETNGQVEIILTSQDALVAIQKEFERYMKEVTEAFGKSKATIGLGLVQYRPRTYLR